ncbi:MAG: hypothetical protein KDD82_14490, partial [Planctomycetes bacterium]|nr:hypothetical protein [Planctomycetota bacterium]
PVLSGRADLAVAIEGPPPAGIAYEPLGELGLLLLVPGAAPLASRRRSLDAKALRELSFVVYPEGTSGRRFTEATLAQAGVDLRVAAEASSASAMQALVRAGVGPAFVPAPLPGARRVRRRERKDGTVSFDVTDLLQRFTDLPRFGVYRRAGAQQGGIVAACCAALHAQLKKTR